MDIFMCLSTLSLMADMKGSPKTFILVISY